MPFLRFVVARQHPDSGVSEGVFATAYRLVDAADTSRHDRESLKRHLKWFAAHLKIPDRFNRTSSKGFYRKNTKGIAWFRDDALEYVSRMHDIKRILDANGEVVEVLQEDRVGYIVYTDEVQVVAEPFADTRHRL